MEQMSTTKLNYKRTVLVGFAFMSICSFWQLYNFVIPLILKHTFHVSDSLSGFIMAADNVLALIMLPLFGKLSDSTSSRLGKRTPYILFGTIASVALMTVIPIVDWNATRINNGEASLGSSQLNFILFFVALGLLLIAMSTYRSPAVALMPDVTPKPLRSKGNAVINLMGALGGIFAYGIIAVVAPKIQNIDELTGFGTKNGSYFNLFAIVGGFMVASAIVLLCTIRENKLAALMPHDDEEDAPEKTAEQPAEKQKLPGDVRASLIFILLSVALWYIAYNAVDTAYSRFAISEWGISEGTASTMMIVAMLVATVSYIPVGIISSKLGRKKVIIGGVIIMGLAFAAACFIHSYSWVAYLIMSIIGIGWASINVNSYPMVVEMSKGSDVGKYTGYYYAFSMAAQIITPILSGYLFDYFGTYNVLFPYAVFFTALALVTMLFVRHGDNRPESSGSVIEAFDVED